MLLAVPAILLVLVLLHGKRLSGSHAAQLFSFGSPRDMPPFVVYRVFTFMSAHPNPTRLVPISDPLGLRAHADGLTALWGVD